MSYDIKINEKIFKECGTVRNIVFAEAKIFHGEVVGIRVVNTFHGVTIQESI